jgi:hypothetical protein
MSQRLPPPWLRFPDSPRDARPSQEAIDQFTDWLRFLYALSPDELAEYERDYPAPPSPEWEWCYKRAAAALHDMPKKLEVAMQSCSLIEKQSYSLIEKMWQTTTLK